MNASNTILEPVTIRVATDDDAAAVAAVYAPYVEETGISFEYEVPSVSEMGDRIRAAHLWLVAEQAGRMVGYAYAGAFAARAAYQWSCELSVYIEQGSHRLGVGRTLIGEIISRVRELGYVSAFAGIALPNAGSSGLFESFGFERVATYRNVGYKLGTWYDVGWWQLALNEPGTPPSPIAS
jgi:phosphinothricin acetyltransferase